MPVLKQDYEEFSKMSTQTLMDIIHKDSFLPDGEEFDQEFIKYITDVIAGRNDESPVADIPDADKAWDSFLNDYLEPYQIDEDKGAVLCYDKLTADNGNQRRKSKLKLARVACIAAVVTAIVIFMGSMTAYAMGYDLWGNIATWTSETFRFKSGNTSQINGEKDVPEVIQEFKELMAENGVSSVVLPGWLPEGYFAANTSCYDMGDSVLLNCYLEKDNSPPITLEYIVHRTSEFTSEYQKNDGAPEIYEHGGTEYGIMQNVDTYYAVWLDGNIECFVSGFSSRDELIKVINSI